MANREKVIKGLKSCIANNCRDCPYPCHCEYADDWPHELYKETLELMKEQEKEIKSLRLLVEWAEECDFGFDQFPDEYERYKDEINDMKYIDGMVHIAKRTLEDQGAFEKG